MSATMLVCKQLTHVYAGKAALSGINLELTAGQPIGLVGPNGAGKTTLLSILSGFLKPTAGEVRLFGYPPGANALLGKVTALPQDARLDPGFTLLTQLMFYARLTGMSKAQARLEAQRVLAAVALETMQHEKPLALSHGMAKRVAIAQALMGNPQLVLLDEPTAGLDPVNVRTMRAVILEQAAKTTFIISSHDLTELDRLCQRVLLLDRGQLQSTDLAAEATDNAKKFFTLQLEDYPAAAVLSALQALDGVLEVTNPQQQEFVVAYNPQLQPDMDIQLLQCLKTRGWAYKQLSQGKTLEEALFFSA